MKIIAKSLYDISKASSRIRCFRLMKNMPFNCSFEIYDDKTDIECDVSDIELPPVCRQPAYSFHPTMICS